MNTSEAAPLAAQRITADAAVAAAIMRARVDDDQE